MGKDAESIQWPGVGAICCDQDGKLRHSNGLHEIVMSQIGGSVSCFGQTKPWCEFESVQDTLSERRTGPRSAAVLCQLSRVERGPRCEQDATRSKIRIARNHGIRRLSPERSEPHRDSGIFVPL